MKKDLFPVEFLKHSVEVYQFRHSRVSYRLYWGIVLFLVLSFLALPFVKVNVYTTVRGIIKPQQERLHLRMTASGQVMESRLVPNALVNKGDTLLRLAYPVLAEKQRLLTLQKEEKQEHIHDLDQLCQKKIPPKLRTATYQKQWRRFIAGKNEINVKKKKLENDFLRANSLYEKDIISKVEWEEAQHAYSLAKVAEAQHQQQAVAQWEKERQQYTSEQQRLQSLWEQAKQEQQPYYLIAPARGTLLLSEGIMSGTWIQAGQLLGTLSPEGALIVEAYVPSHQIGLIAPKTNARYQIDAYNYRQWGMATGQVLEKGKDVELINEQALFKLRCSLNQKKLYLSNGVEGQLQKGLGLTVLLYQNRRSLFDLLYDDVNDWMNPNQPQNLAL